MLSVALKGSLALVTEETQMWLSEDDGQTAQSSSQFALHFPEQFLMASLFRWIFYHILNPVDWRNILSGLSHYKIVLDYFNSIRDDDEMQNYILNLKGE